MYSHIDLQSGMIKKEKTTRNPSQKRGILTKQKIVHAALELFSQQGYYKTNSKEIAKKADVSIGSFYMYFKDKKTLLEEVFSFVFDDISNRVFTEDLFVKIAESDGRNMVKAVIEALNKAHSISPDFHKEAISMIYSDSDIFLLNKEKEDYILHLLIRILEMRRDDLRISDIEASARIIYKSAEEVIHSINIFKPDIDENRLLRSLEDMICRYLFE